MPPTLAELRDRWPTRAESRRAAGLLRERRWQQVLLGVVLLSIVFVLLGRWQWHRHESRQARNDLVETNYSAPPVPLGQLLPGAARDAREPLPAALQWRPVSVTGSYLEAETLLARNRPHQGNAGYEVLVPLRTSDGVVLFVDRGWIPAGSAGAARPDAVPSPPTGEVTVVARLKAPEPASRQGAPAGQVSRIDVARMATTLAAGDAERVVLAYGVLVSEAPRPGDGSGQQPLLLDPPDPGLGINLAYAFQWWAFALAAYVLLGVGLVREIRRNS